MPIEKDLVEVGRTSFNEPRIFCAHCHQPADYTQTTDQNGGLRYELMCPNPPSPAAGHGRPITLGSWSNEQQRAGEIRAFIEGQLRAQNRT